MRRLRSWRTVAAVGVVAIVLLVMSLLEGDVAEDLTGFGSLVSGMLNRFGAVASFALLYIEESGVPLPVPGDVYVAYLGKLNSTSISNLLLAWLGIIAVVVGGSTNLYLVSRRFGPALLRHRFVYEVLGVDEARLERVRRWSKRWGALAIIFGRHVPGFRIPVTVLAATTGVPYRIFAPSVAISTAVWAAIGLWVGATFGQSLGNLLARYPWLYLVALGLVIVAVAVALVRFWRVNDHAQLPIEVRNINPISKSTAGVPFEHAAPQATTNATSTDREAADQRPGSR
jgi:membrane protein DedA with SNARE-associated domain